MKRALRPSSTRAPTSQDLLQPGADRRRTHAEGQVVSFELDGRIAPIRLVAALNARLPEDISVLTAEVAPEGFHAHCSAWRRRCRCPLP